MLQPFPYEELFHYSQKFTRGADLRQDPVLLARQHDKRFGDRSEIRSLKNKVQEKAMSIWCREVNGDVCRFFYGSTRTKLIIPYGDSKVCLDF